LGAQRAAAEYLRQLLLKPGPYRDAWQRLSTRPRDDVINQLAVAEVIAGQQDAARRRPGAGQVLPYQVRDVVSGALFGGILTAETLQIFIEAFGFTEEESSRLRRLLAGSTRIRVLSGLSALPICAMHEVDAAIGQRNHHTVALHDHIWVTADGRIDRARTMQVIEAGAARVDRIPFMCDTNVLTLEIGQGCKELLGDVRRIGQDVFAAPILLASTLDLGETLTLEYWHSYRYAGDPCDPREREFRRGGLRQIDNLDLRVEFHPDKLPSRVWWAHWDGGDGRVLQREMVSLDIQHSVHRYLRSLEKTVAGFYWEWD
ncbi:MAG: hypothetical protein J2P28_15675, partial [Actinobacteria bacterium]|nr:hypothetical protein [Actinomycetota bacterium]